ncbi:hypothetical protein LSH36_550g01005 [Paralvinella palmiformis]|uniref:EF-hand domain-containing protein n=1 Tax=Paralvinella palmiformis TaxID=53620 RepID=A0AAD9J7B9_9ANNE|nr:hypothetical protein LSH36_550g01005 [Paralvinella palmiformis]
MEKTKEEFVQFIRHAMMDKNSNEFIEFYQFLINCFIRADSNMDGQVSVDEFDQLIEEAAHLPRKHGFAPKTSDLYPTDEARQEARAKLFREIDSNQDGHITFDEWLEFTFRHVTRKLHLVDKDLLAGDEATKDEFVAFIQKANDRTTPEYRELFHFLLKCFVDADKDHDGAVQPVEFDAMIEMATAAPRRLGLAPNWSSLYETNDDRVEKRKEIFNAMDANGDGNISFDEWLKYVTEHIVGKVGTQ